MDQPWQAEFRSVRIQSLGGTVGVKEDAVSGGQRDDFFGDDPIEHAAAVNAHGHARRPQRKHFAAGRTIEQRRIVAGPGQGHIVGPRVDHDIEHADEHVLLDVGIKSPIDGTHDFGRRGAAGSGGAEQAAAHAGDEGGGNAFARDVGDGQPPMVFVDPQVIKIISADVPRGDVQSAHFISGDLGRAGREEDALDFAGRFEVAVETPLLSGFEVHGFAEKREGGLLGDRFEHGKVVGTKGRAHWSVDHGQNA